MKTKVRESAGGVVVNGGRIVVVRQRHRVWSLPKGHLKKGEGPMEAARREIREEAGVEDLTFVRELGTYERYKIGLDGGDDRSELKIIHMLHFTTGATELGPQDEKIEAAIWADPDEAVALLTNDKDREFLRGVLPELR